MLLAVCRLTSSSIITGLPVVHPVIISVFGRSIQKRSPGGGKTRGLEPRNDVLSTYFIRFSLARIFFVSRPCSSPPSPPRNPEGVANRGGYLRLSKRFDHITNHRKESLYKVLSLFEFKSFNAGKPNNRNAHVPYKPTAYSR